MAILNSELGSPDLLPLSDCEFPFDHFYTVGLVSCGALLFCGVEFPVFSVCFNHLLQLVTIKKLVLHLFYNFIVDYSQFSQFVSKIPYNPLEGFS